MASCCIGLFCLENTRKHMKACWRRPVCRRVLLGARCSPPFFLSLSFYFVHMDLPSGWTRCLFVGINLKRVGSLSCLSREWSRPFVFLPCLVLFCGVFFVCPLFSCTCCLVLQYIFPLLYSYNMCILAFGCTRRRCSWR